MQKANCRKLTEWEKQLIQPIFIVGIVCEVSMYLEHGDYTIQVKNNVVIIQVKGQFNEYGGKRLADELKKTIEGFQGEKFAIITNMSELEGATPETFVEGDAYNKWLYEKGVVAKAIVFNSMAMREINISRMPTQKLINLAFFKHQEEAWSWIIEQLKQV